MGDEEGVKLPSHTPRLEGWFFRPRDRAGEDLALVFHRRRAANKEHVADTVVATDRHYHLVRPLSERKDAFVYVLVRSAEVRLVDARKNLARALGVIDDSVVETLATAATESDLEALMKSVDDSS